MLKVKLVRYDDLSEDEREDQPNNGSGKEYANYVKISHNNKTLMVLSDAVEREDATFSRDFKVVIKAIETAYKKGKKDGSDKEELNILREKVKIFKSALYDVREAEDTEDAIAIAYVALNHDFE